MKYIKYYYKESLGKTDEINQAIINQITFILTNLMQNNNEWRKIVWAYDFHPSILTGIITKTKSIVAFGHENKINPHLQQQIIKSL